MSEAQVSKPWFQQPWVWVLIGIPGVAVVVGFTMLYFAIESFDGMVVDDYYKQGKEINLVLRRDRHAHDMHLQAELLLSPQQGTSSLRLRTRKGFVFPDRLKLSFMHATRAGFDQQVAMIHQGGGRYAGAFPQLHQGSWYVVLEDPAWRISGQMATARQYSIPLAPVSR